MSKGVCIEIRETGERRMIGEPVWIKRNRNGPVVTPWRCQALGVGDGAQIWSLGGLEGYPEAKIITRAEYDETLTEPEADPELTAEQALDIIMGGTI